MHRVFSYTTGWRALVSEYPVIGGMQFSEKHRLLNLAMRKKSNLELCVTLHINPHGILVSMSYLFWPMYPRFFVPWSDIKTEDTDETRAGLMPRYEQVILRFQRVPESPFYLRKTEWEKVLKKAGRKS
ncbi:MAG: hypothetical protein H8E17_19200 [Deltaproteobacteria bacterium]|nr:hypothetical protein [Deltaproteobacteria bacterium]